MLSNSITVTLPDASTLQVADGESLYEIIGRISPRLQKDALAAAVDGVPVDLSCAVHNDAPLRVITFDSPEGKSIFWHSASHLMAQAVKRLYPDAKFAIGPSIESGFYYDIDMSATVSPENLARIEEMMRTIVDEDLAVRREEMKRKDAIAMFTKAGEIYKVEMLEEMGDDTVSIYRQGGFLDLCRGPHVMSTSRIRNFKLLSIAGAYWRGDEKRTMLQRIYGTAFPEKKQLEQHLKFLEEARNRDHRKLGRELDLFSFSNEVGAGLPLWHPNGAVLRYIIEKFSTDEHLKRGYKLFSIPHIAKAELYRTSGHLDFYSENMYAPIRIDGQDYYLKPMNCPSQIKIFTSSIKSYRDLPFRGFEMGTVYRYERSGVLHGLTRVRGFTQDDAHIFCSEDQIEDEIKDVLDFTLFMLKTFGFTERSIYLSTRPEGSVGSDRNWELATSALKNTLESGGIAYTVDPGEGVFYGPKIDIKIKDAIGREWQCSTIQVDFNLPERFDVQYIGSDGRKHRPIMIHRALLGSLERFIGILIEHYSGKFPVWLAPVQLILINVSDDEAGPADELRLRMLELGFRPEIDRRDESMGYRVRDAIARKIPFIGVIGKKEVAEGTISVRKLGESKSVSMKIEDLIDMIRGEVENRH
ncbi:MAG: threonine--tRNA ligase [Spirochaetes bacterium RBG_13_51_14]|nr:MAG: threonine--tRNA ligase [Spirochaetes bacterium RBG_13_51_14]